MQGKSIWGLHKTYYGIFREENKSGGSDGFGQFREEQVWKNKGVRDKRGLSPLSSWLVGTLVWPCPVWGSELSNWNECGRVSKHVMASEDRAQLASE